MRGFQHVTGSKAPMLPQRQTTFSAGYDFYLPEDVTIPAHGRTIIKSGVKAFMRYDEVLMLFIRSSLAIKRNLMLTNAVGIIDADYYNNQQNEGEIMCQLYNDSDIDCTLHRGERFMQGIFTDFLLTNDDNASGARVGGVGSTNKKEKNI